MSLCVVRFVGGVFCLCISVWLVLVGFVWLGVFCVCGSGFCFCGVCLFALTGTKLLSPLLRDGHETGMGRQSNKS